MSNYSMLGYALAPLFLYAILWLFRPLVRYLWRRLPEGRLKRVLFFRWEA